jgi:hypothetical protein
MQFDIQDINGDKLTELQDDKFSVTVEELKYVAVKVHQSQVFQIQVSVISAGKARSSSELKLKVKYI